MLFFEMCRILRDKQPICFIAENVKGLLSANEGAAFPLIINEFKNSGYKVTHSVLNAVNYGVPQKRERVIIIGIRNDFNMRFAFNDALESSESDYIALGDFLEKDIQEKYYFSDRAVEGMMKKRATMNKGRAQDIAKPCNTVGSHLAKISLNSTDPVLFENGRYRRFTPREVARIQSFPESFTLSGSDTAQYRALGNAIPPILMWHITRSLIEQLMYVLPESMFIQAS
jgi:DNA (cytosine-5)-methyltransferase 1